MQRVIEEARHAAESPEPALILGESGVGKSFLARSMHADGVRALSSLVEVICASTSSDLLANELFGHAGSAYTGAGKAEEGLFAQANDGTVFLDEIGVLPPEAQTLLLGVLDTGRYRPMGGRRDFAVDCKVLAATNIDMDKAITEESFRRDLFERLAGDTICIPPLRERPGDIVPLARRLLTQECSHEPLALSSDACEGLLTYRWPGNVRELAKIICKAARRANQGVIERKHVTESFRAGSFDRPVAYTDAKLEFERQYVIERLAEAKGCVSDAARRAGQPLSTFKAIMSRSKVDARQFRQSS